MRIFLALFLFFNSLLALSELEEGLKLYEANKFDKAYEIFKSLCEKDISKACFSLAFMYESAKGMSKDLNQAYKFFNKACTLGESLSCNNIALFYEKEKDGQMASSFYKRSCDLKNARACYQLGSLYDKGELVKASVKSALAFYSKSCTLGFGESCYLLGRYNQLEKQDLTKAKRYFGMACDQKHQEACAAYKELNSKDIELY
ncbi:sel1 repeat family protein [Campylobacter jejuni]|nr:sel1 repeat family protein [Campylobacter jejuni]